MSLSAYSVATQGLTAAPLVIALQGFVVVEVPLVVSGGGGGGRVREKVKAARRLNDFLDRVLREEIEAELVEDALEAAKALSSEGASTREALTEAVEEFAEERSLPDVRAIVSKALAAVEEQLRKREAEEEEEFIVLKLLFS